MPDKDTIKLNLIDRILDLFASPAELMRNIRACPAVFAPFCMCVLISLAQLPLTEKYAEIQRRWLSNVSIERYGVDYFNLAAASEDDEDGAAETVSLITRASTAASAVITYPLSAFLSALGLFILTKAARGKETRLVQYFSMYMHLFIIAAAGAALTSFICVSLDTALNVASLAAVFMPLGDVTSVAYNILSSVTVFNIWITVLTVIGVRSINDFSWLKSVIIGAAGYAVSVAINAATLSLTFYAFDFLDNFSFM
jgi:hypothetical protein